MQALVEYFENELPNLGANYNWLIPSIEGFDGSGEAGYTENCELKHFLKRKWERAQDNGQRLDVARTVIAEWGGIGGNTEDRLGYYVDQVQSDNPETLFGGVASYSKLYSIVKPKKYAIYDSRVSACLNAIQYLADKTPKIAFNYCPSRGAHAVGQFIAHPNFKVGNLVNQGWQRIPRAETYARYLEVLNDCRSQLPGNPQLRDLEMILFANAVQECQAAIQLGEG